LKAWRKLTDAEMTFARATTDFTRANKETFHAITSKTAGYQPTADNATTKSSTLPPNKRKKTSHNVPTSKTNHLNTHKTSTIVGHTDMDPMQTTPA
jgi:flagellar motor protein MotB